MTLAGALPDDLSIATVALPGHGPDVPGEPVADARALAEAIAAEIALQPLSAQLTLLGNSFGALLAFETCLALERLDAEGARRLHLVVSGFRAPSRPPADAPLHRLPRARLLSELRDCFGAVGGPDLGDVLGPEQEAALRADLAACETYRPGSARPFHGALTVIRLLADASVSQPECAAWGEVCAGATRFRTLATGHFPWTSAPAALAELIREAIRVTSAVSAAPKPAPAGRSTRFPPARE